MAGYILGQHLVILDNAPVAGYALPTTPVSSTSHVDEHTIGRKRLSATYNGGPCPVRISFSCKQHTRDCRTHRLDSLLQLQCEILRLPNTLLPSRLDIVVVTMVDTMAAEALKPTMPSKLTLEAWSQGFMIGALMIMCGITLTNMRRGVLLHKLILIEVSGRPRSPPDAVPAC